MTFDAHVTVRSGRPVVQQQHDRWGECVEVYEVGSTGLSYQQQCHHRSTVQAYLESLMVRVPTGGSVEAELRYGNPAFSGATITLVRSDTGSIRSAAEIVASIKAYLSLNLAEVARILHVQRPTIYAWLDGSQEPRDANLRRLNRVFGVVTRLRRQFDTSLGEFVRKPDDTGVRLIQLFESESLDDDAITAAVARIRAAMNANDANSRKYRLRPSGVTAKSSAMEDASVDRAVRKFSRSGRR